jgi:hypothetical protein
MLLDASCKMPNTPGKTIIAMMALKSMTPLMFMIMKHPQDPLPPMLLMILVLMAVRTHLCRLMMPPTPLVATVLMAVETKLTLLFRPMMPPMAFISFVRPFLDVVRLHVSVLVQQPMPPVPVMVSMLTPVPVKERVLRLTLHLVVLERIKLTSKPFHQRQTVEEVPVGFRRTADSSSRDFTPRHKHWIDISLRQDVPGCHHSMIIVEVAKGLLFRRTYIAVAKLLPQCMFDALDKGPNFQRQRPDASRRPIGFHGPLNELLQHRRHNTGNLDLKG